MSFVSGDDWGLVVQPPAYQLYWCGYGENIPEPVNNLINIAKKGGRDAFFVSTDGFDKTLLNLSIACFEDNNAYLKRVKEIQGSFTNNEYSCTPFSIAPGAIHKVIKSNLFPFSIPKECFQFEVSFKQGEKPWKICSEITSKHEITAVPFKGMIYAFGTKDELSKSFAPWKKSDVIRTPISRNDIIDITALKELIVKTITKVISIKSDLSCNFKNKIWDKSNTMNIQTDKLSLSTKELDYLCFLMKDIIIWQ